jgi:hypothetical protein
MKGRSFFEEYLYRRSQSSQPESEEQRDPRRRVNLALRYLGIILPMVLSYGLGAFYFGTSDNLTGYWVARILGAAALLGCAAALSLRRDWHGAAAITGVYLFFDAWLWFTVMD